jgi:receptor protein-tyrosine kinase
MSLIEQAMLRAGVSVTQGRKPDDHHQRAHWRDGAPQQPVEDARVTLKIDIPRLRRAGVLASPAETSRVDDQFRRIKRPLLANALGRGGRTVPHGNRVMVTSSVAGEGKTHTAINLALHVARELDHAALLVDADVIKHTTSEVLGASGRPGLLDLLNDGGLAINDAILHTNVPRLSLLPAGTVRASVTELISSQRMRRLAEDLADAHPGRILIFDSPPLLATAEAQVLAEIMGQIVLVVEACSTAPSAVKEAAAMLDRSKPIGLVLNKSRQLLSADYYGGYYK